MKVAILGSGGMLGYAMTQFFSKEKHEVLAISRKEFDLAKGQLPDLWKIMESFGTEVVINCAGVIKPQIAKMSIEDVLKVNSIFPQNLGLYTQSRKIKAFQVTTDCVYSGQKGNYSESDFFDATDVYGMSKNGGEPHSLMTLRTSIIGEEKEQSRSLLEWARSQAGKNVNGFTNHRWNGVTTVQLAMTIDQILKKGLYRPGLYHVHSPAAVSKDELLRIMSRAYDLKLDVTEKEGPEFCDRTLSSVHSLSRELVTMSIEEQVIHMKKFFQ